MPTDNDHQEVMGALACDWIAETASTATQGSVQAGKALSPLSVESFLLVPLSLTFHNYVRASTNEIVEIIRCQSLKGRLLQPRSELDRSRDDDLTLPIQGDQVIAIVEHNGLCGSRQTALQVVQFR